MIISEQKPLEEVLEILKGKNKIFIIGCGDCATTCKTGGEPELLKMKDFLEKQGKTVTGWVVPETTCITAQAKIAMAKNKAALKEADAILVMACGSGAQLVKECLRFDLPVYSANNTLFGAVVDDKGNFVEYCSACGECVLQFTGGICPVTRCSKGLLNGPCGGQNEGKCEVDPERDCAWALIYEELKKKNKLYLLKEIRPPKDYSKLLRPHKLILNQPPNK